MRIERVRTGNLFGLDMNGFVSRYGSDPVQVRSGGGLVARAQHAYGRGDRSSISATQRLHYDPVYAGDGISLVRPPTGFEGIVNVDPTGLYFRESFTSDSTVGLSTELSPRDRVNAGYGYTLRDYLDDAGGDSKHHNVTVSYDRQLSRSYSVQTNYQWAKADVDLNARFALPLSEHIITVGPQYVKRLSPTRRITVGGGIGGTYVTERNQLTGAETATWAPSGQAHAAIDITRDWSLDGNYARSVTINQGLTRQSLLLDSATISLHGLPHDRVELSSVFGFSVQARDVGEPIVGNSDYRSHEFLHDGPHRPEPDLRAGTHLWVLRLRLRRGRPARGRSTALLAQRRHRRLDDVAAAVRPYRRRAASVT